MIPTPAQLARTSSAELPVASPVPADLRSRAAALEVLFADVENVVIDAQGREPRLFETPRFSIAVRPNGERFELVVRARAPSLVAIDQHQDGSEASSGSGWDSMAPAIRFQSAGSGADTTLPARIAVERSRFEQGNRIAVIDVATLKPLGAVNLVVLAKPRHGHPAA